MGPTDLCRPIVGVVHAPGFDSDWKRAHNLTGTQALRRCPVISLAIQTTKLYKVAESLHIFFGSEMAFVNRLASASRNSTPIRIGRKRIVKVFFFRWNKSDNP